MAEIALNEMSPIAALLIAWLSIGENPSYLEILSAAFIIGGAILIQVIDTKAGATHREQQKREEALSLFASAKQD